MAGVIEQVFTELGTARDSCDRAVTAMRDVDRVDPVARRRLVGSLDDLNLEAQRVAAALNRLGERSQQDTVISAEETAGLLGAPE
jgi:hypothetical protein